MQTLRERARISIASGPVTPNYAGAVETAIKLLQTVVATELVCVLRYTMHAVSVEGISSKSIVAEFAEHAASERGLLIAAANRIDQLAICAGLPVSGSLHPTL